MVWTSNRAGAEIGDLIADSAIGQSSLTDSEALPIGPATFAGPTAVAIDPDPTRNRVYVSDRVHNRVLGWSNADALTDGAPATMVIGQPDFYSWGCNRSTDGANEPATMSSLCEPKGLAVDSAGSLYVVDYGNCRVLIFFDPFATDQAADLVIGENLTCNGVTVSADKLFLPSGVTVDAADNVFVSDSGNERVLEYDGPLPATDTRPDRVFGQPDFVTRDYGGAALYSPEGLALDGAGNLYVGSMGWIYEFDRALSSDPGIDRRLGSGNCNQGGESASTTCAPMGVAADGAGRLYVADAGNSRILEFDSPLTVNQAARVIGQPGFTGSTTWCNTACNTGNTESPGEASASSLCLMLSPAATTGCYLDIQHIGITLDASGRLWVADRLNHRVLRYDSPLTSDGVADLVLGQPAMNSARKPVIPLTSSHVTLYSYNAVVLDTANNRLLIFGGLGQYTGLPAAVIGQPDYNSTACNTEGLSASSLCNPTAAVIDNHGNLWIADTGNNRVLEFQYPWYRYDYTLRRYVLKRTADRVFGQPDSTSSACRQGADGLCSPKGVATDARSNLYISDTGNNRIVHHINPLADTIADRVYGQPNLDTRDCTPGSGGAAALCDPRGITVVSNIDPWGVNQGDDLYIADRGNNRVLVYKSTLNKNTGDNADEVFGQAGNMNTGSCAGGAGGLCAPSSIAFDEAGDLYVADTNNNRVLEYDAPLTDTNADRVFGQPDMGTTTCNAGGLSPTAETLCQPEGVLVYTSYEGAVFVADTGNNRVLRYDAPFCVFDFQLTAANRRQKSIRSKPMRTHLKIEYGLDPSTNDDILRFSDRAVLLENDGIIDAGDSPLFTLWTGSGTVFKERVPPWVSNIRATPNGGIWSTDELEADTGITFYHVVTNFYIPPGFSDDPQRDRIGYRGRAVGMDLSALTASQAWWRVQYGGVCFTTELRCGVAGNGNRICKPAKAAR